MCQPASFSPLERSCAIGGRGSDWDRVCQHESGVTNVSSPLRWCVLGMAIGTIAAHLKTDLGAHKSCRECGVGIRGDTPDAAP